MHHCTYSTKNHLRGKCAWFFLNTLKIHICLEMRKLGCGTCHPIISPFVCVGQGWAVDTRECTWCRKGENGKPGPSTLTTHTVQRYSIFRDITQNAAGKRNATRNISCGISLSSTVWGIFRRFQYFLDSAGIQSQSRRFLQYMHSSAMHVNIKHRRSWSSPFSPKLGTRHFSASLRHKTTYSVVWLPAELSLQWSKYQRGLTRL